MERPANPFSFHIFIDQDPAMVVAAEVSGLEANWDAEQVPEGGENRFVHQLPKQATHTNLVIRHLHVARTSGFVTWITDTIQDGLTKPVVPKEMRIEVVTSSYQSVCAWTISKAYPVKWDVGPFDAMQDELAIESVEIAYHALARAADGTA